MKTLRHSKIRGGLARLVQKNDEYHALLIIDGKIAQSIKADNADKAWALLLAGEGQAKEVKTHSKDIDHNVYAPVRDLIEHSQFPIFLTGRAGTGKTTFLKHFLETTELKAIVIAPTGIAALNAGGQTAHSLFKLPPNLIQPQDVRRVREGRLLKSIDILVIDEISMVRSDLMDAIDRSLRMHRGIALPFGGVKLLCVGDAAQLPPVVNNIDKEILDKWFDGSFFFDAPCAKSSKWRIIELSHSFRQTEEHFLNILNNLRHGIISRADYELLETRVLPEPPDKGNDSVILTTTNEAARRINDREMAAIQNAPAIYKGETEGIFDEKLFPTDDELMLKVGARVMLLRNDADRRWVNGSLGTIIATETDHVKVKIGRLIHEVEPVVWERYQYELDKDEEPKRKIVGTFTQLPIRPAWALTIHKSQGLSFDNVHVDFGRGAFAHGQTYVALSRCRSLNGLTISRNIRKSDITIDSHAMGFLHRTELEDCGEYKIGLYDFVQN